MQRCLYLLSALLLSACASGPQFNTAGVATGVTPQEALKRGASFEGQRVLWGGTILASRNLRQTSELEVLGYPLDSSNQRPDTDAKPLGRFLVHRSGYLETVDYSAGREVTVIGHFVGTQAGRVGEARYTYPVLEADKIYLWPRSSGNSGPYFHFGVGVIFGH